MVLRYAQARITHTLRRRVKKLNAKRHNILYYMLSGDPLC